MAGVVVDSVVVELQAKIDKYQRDLAAATKQTEDYFKRMHKASSKPITPTMGRAAIAQANAEAAAVERAEGRKQAARRKTAESEAAAQARISAAVERGIQRQNEQAANAERNAGRIGRAYNKSLASAQTRAMSGTSIGSGVVNTGGIDVTRRQIELETRLAVARAAGAEKTTVALRDQLEKIKLIETYQRRGLSATEAKARAEQRLTSIITARQRREEQAARRNIEQSLRQNRGSVGLGLQGAATAIVGAVGLNEISQLNDKYIEFTNRLRLAGLEGQNQKEVQDALFASAQRYGVELGSLGGIFQKATEAGREYGATQQQNIQFTNAVAAAVKVQGGSVESARGAILQLGQSLQSGTVRAEEFNSMMEGLFPLLQAAAASSDKYGGSVAKLRAAVVDGKVSSEEFFNLILKGSAILEEKAAKATLTTAAGFTTLTNALTVYFGEADKANGVSAAFGEALGLLARNLGTVIPAIAAITLAIGVGYVGAAINGVRMSAALATAQTQAAIAAGTLAAAEVTAAGATTTLAYAMRGLLGLMGGPVGIAITAVTLGLGYLAFSSRDAATNTQNLTKQQSALQKVLDAANTDKMAGATNALSGARSQLTKETIALAKAEAYLRAQQAENALNDAKRGVKRVATTRYETAPDSRRRIPIVTTEEVALGNRRSRGGDGLTERERALALAEKNFIEAGRAVNEVNAAAKLIAAGGGDKPIATATAVGAKTGGASSGPTGPTAAEIEARFQQEMSRLRIEELQARLQLTDDAQARADLQREILREEYKARVDEINANKDFKPEQRQQQIDALNKLYGTPTKDANGDLTVGIPGVLSRGITRDLLIQQERDAADIAAASSQNAQDLLRSDLQLADTREEKLALEMRLLDLAYEQERAELEATKASRELLLGKKAETDAQWRIANDRLQTLDKLKAGDVAAAQRQNEGPLAAYARSFSAASFEDQAESLVVSELQSVQDGIANALSGAIGTKNSFLKSLISLFVQQVIMRPIAEALAQSGGGGGGGGIFGAILSVGKSLIPRASGGHVTSGNPYLVGENGPELFSPAGSGKIIPTGQLNGMRGGNIIVNQSFTLDARYGITTTQLLEYTNRVASEKATQAASVASRAVYEGIPKRMQQYNINGV